MHKVKAKGILSASNGINIYRGCLHGCIYCDSRSDCYQMKHKFEDIEVKENAPELSHGLIRQYLRNYGVIPIKGVTPFPLFKRISPLFSVLLFPLYQ